MYLKVNIYVEIIFKMIIWYKTGEGNKEILQKLGLMNNRNVILYFSTQRNRNVRLSFWRIKRQFLVIRCFKMKSGQEEYIKRWVCRCLSECAMKMWGRKC